MSSLIPITASIQPSTDYYNQSVVSVSNAAPHITKQYIILKTGVEATADTNRGKMKFCTTTVICCGDVYGTKCKATTHFGFLVIRETRLLQMCNFQQFWFTFYDPLCPYNGLRFYQWFIWSTKICLLTYNSSIDGLFKSLSKLHIKTVYCAFRFARNICGI